jgi:hypothetical protein
LDPARYVTVGRSYFQPEKGRVEELGEGKYLWLGTFQSVRIGWKIHLNVDMANKPSYKKGNFLAVLL